MGLRNLISVELTLMSSAGPRLQEARLSQSRNVGCTTSFNNPSAVDLIPAAPGEDQYDRVYMVRFDLEVDCIFEVIQIHGEITWRRSVEIVLVKHRRIITSEIRRKSKTRPRKWSLVRTRDKYLVVQWRLQNITRLFHPDSFRKVVCGGCGDPYENYLA